LKVSLELIRRTSPEEPLRRIKVRIFLLFVALGLAPIVAPGFAKASETKQAVDVAIYVIDISEVQELQQSVVADFVIIARWHQDDLEDPDAPELRIFSLDQVESPRLFVINARRLREKFGTSVEVDRTGQALLRQRYQGTLSVPMDLRNFPMDVQTFEIAVGTLDYRGRKLVADPRRSGAMQSFTVAGWRVEPVALESGELMAPDGNHYYSTITAVYTAERNGLFFAWKLFIPLGLIVLMAYAVFWLDPTALSTQIGIATSTVFTLIAYNFALSSILPQISYLTRADLYMIGCMLLVFGALGEAVITGVLARKETHLALARRIDLIARFVYPAIYAIVIFVAFF